MNTISSVNILGIPLYAGTLSSAVNLVINRCCEVSISKNLRISATGAHGLVTSYKIQSFKRTLSTCYLNLPDGMPGVWIGRLKGQRQMQRCYGPDFFELLIKRSAEYKINHFFCGGKSGIAEKLRQVCQDKMHNTNIRGTYCPPFRTMTDNELQELGKHIDSCNTDILWIGLSTPKQELFAEKIAQFTNVRFIISVGAAFDFHTGNVIQAPKILQRSGLEWFFRLCMEPKRLFRRYSKIVPLFIFYNINEFIALIFFKNRRSFIG